MDLKDKNVKNLDTHLIDLYIGKRLKLRRVMLHMSQDELASMIGVTFQQIQKYESGINRVSASRLLVIAKILQVDVLFFFDGIENEIPQFETVPDVVAEQISKFDPLTNNETLTLINAYWKLSDIEKRQKILDFIVSMV